MSHWTQLHASFRLDARQPLISVNLHDPDEPLIDEYNLLKTALTRLGLMDEGDDISNIFSCIEEPTLADVVANLKATARDWDDHHGTFLPSFDIITSKSRTYLPLLPMTPTGSEGPPSVVSSFDDSTNNLVVTVIGSLRDFSPDMALYIEFWVKYIAVLFSTDVLYSYENYDKRVTKYIDPYELSTEERVNIIITYISTFRKWYAGKKDNNANTPSWTHYLIKEL